MLTWRDFEWYCSLLVRLSNCHECPIASGLGNLTSSFSMFICSGSCSALIRWTHPKVSEVMMFVRRSYLMFKQLDDASPKQKMQIKCLFMWIYLFLLWALNMGAKMRKDQRSVEDEEVKHWIIFLIQNCSNNYIYGSIWKSPPVKLFYNSSLNLFVSN